MTKTALAPMKNSLSRKFFYALPPSWRYLIRRLYYLPLDLWEKWTGKRPAMVPPRGLIFTGGGDFIQEGERLLRYCRELGGLQPDHHVLDIGSGMGRAARALSGFLSEYGRYDGFDLIQKGVNWCQQHISSRHPNFHFTYVPLKNDLYRSDGQAASQFSFPYSDHSMDFIIVNSVFTHMLPEEVVNYLQEIRRVLKKGGRVYATFFIMTPVAKNFMEEKQTFRFDYDHGHYLLMHPTVKAANVAFTRTWLQDQLKQNNLNLEKHIPGFWSGRPKGEHPSFQDILILSA